MLFNLQHLLHLQVQLTISFTTGTAGLTNGQNVRILVTNPDGNAARSGTDLVVSDGPVFVTTSLPNSESLSSYSQNIDVTGDSAVTIGTMLYQVHYLLV